eukprot:CAMPEP_0113700594 /NCGR_PEP_ID=MMETSP0038_2-20120614/24058_1 /TAXON_ID=2898 /ORGANISM="Cryptomonas paramecium" /LENGTH=31 /DNA_ID=CAMNT_0000624297 /DNA_START=127 /DNA_END=219 /DNA_ORIENTATION=+ /assembly_acc=CAM_ASM_000170
MILDSETYLEFTTETLEAATAILGARIGLIV